MERLAHDLHPAPRGAGSASGTQPTAGMPALLGVQDMDVLQGEGGLGDPSSQLPGAGGAPGQVLERRYDLVVAEPDLPGLSGYALCSWYKEAARQASHCASHAEVKFVALSSEPDTDACAAFGIDYCISKPLTASCFARLLMLWLDS